MIHLIATLWILGYALLALFSVYVAVTGKLVPGEQPWMGKLVIGHGKAVIVILILSVAFAGAFMLKELVLAGLHINIVTG